MNLKNIKIFLKKNKIIFNFLLSIRLFIVSIYSSFLMTVFKLFKITNNKIVVVNYHGKGYGDNGKYIVEKLLKEGKFLIYWATNESYRNTLPTNVKYVKYNSIKYFYHLTTAKVWINNCRFDYGILKRKQQFYIQTWHAGLGLKKVEQDAGDLGIDYILSAKKDSKMIDMLISNCKYRTDIFKNSFWYHGDVSEIGLPRNDIFFDDKIKEETTAKVYSFYKFDKEDIIILYAPTFRANETVNPFDIDFDKLVKDYKNKFNKNVKVLIRLHPNIADRKNLFSYNDSIINATDYPDIQELIIASKILITDYSSCMFDAMLCGNDVYLYALDLEDYLSNRGINFEYQDLPFSKSYSIDEINDKILNNDVINYKDKLIEFKKEMNLTDNGKASDVIVKRINEVINGGINYEKI